MGGGPGAAVPEEGRTEEEGGAEGSNSEAGGAGDGRCAALLVEWAGASEEDEEEEDEEGESENSRGGMAERAEGGGVGAIWRLGWGRLLRLSRRSIPSAWRLSSRDSCRGCCRRPLLRSSRLLLLRPSPPSSRMDAKLRLRDTGTLLALVPIPRPPCGPSDLCEDDAVGFARKVRGCGGSLERPEGARNGGSSAAGVAGMARTPAWVV